MGVSQLRADIMIAFAVKELSRSLQQPDNEDLKTLKQFLRYIKGTSQTLAPKVEHNEQGQTKAHHCYTSAEHNLRLHFHRLRQNSMQWDKQHLKHNTANKYLKR
eukprot:4202414-Amphidinium_carterae.1